MDIDLLDWWKLNCTRFPNLSKMSKDYLAIQSTLVPSEQVFSKAELRKLKNNLTGQNNKKLEQQIVQNERLIKNGEVSVVEVQKQVNKLQALMIYIRVNEKKPFLANILVNEFKENKPLE
ncbi:40934_t:CDS:2, partial [Gigaspora margarita]